MEVRCLGVVLRIITCVETRKEGIKRPEVRSQKKGRCILGTEGILLISDFLLLVLPGQPHGFTIAASHTLKLETSMHRTARWTSVFLLLVILIALPALSGTVPTAKPEEVGLSSERLQRIHDLIQRYIDSGNFTGAVTVVARRGRIAHFEAQGLMDLETKKPMAKDAVFRIMSMTKPVVGVSILMLMEEGKVRLNDPISKFIPQFKDLKVAVPQPAQGPPPAAAPGAAPPEPRFYVIPADREITVRDLLTHTSGLLSGQISNREAAKVALKKGEILSDWVPRLGAVPLEFQPGTRWAYSAQAGFDTLARIVEITSGLNFEQFIRQRIFDPLGMKDTCFYPAESAAPRIVTLYQKTPKGFQKQDNPPFMNGVYFSGGGGLFSTAEDYLQFAQMLVNGGQLNGKRLLSPRTVEMMRSVYAPDTLPGRTRGEGYGLSVRVICDPVANGTALSNGTFGWSGAFGTHFFVDPKEKIAAILMTQTAGREVTYDFETAVMQAIVEQQEAGK
jgi:CubicO group peptidase (beta-lactamase class C family)